MDIKLCKDYVKSLMEARTPWISLYQDIEQYLLPGRGLFMTADAQPNTGDKKHSKIINGAGVYSMRLLGSCLHSWLTSPARPWFRLKLGNDDIEENGLVRDWLQRVQTILMNIYSQSNFYTTLHQGYEELGGFGTAVILQEEDDKDIVRFTLFPCGTYLVDQNYKKIIDVVFIHFWMTAKQMVERFGEDKVSNMVKESYRKKSNKSFQVCFGVYPREKRDITSPRNNDMPFEAIWFEYTGSDDKPLLVSGYHENPFHCPRWDVVGADVYGRSPAMDALGDAKELQSLERALAKGVHKSVDPPVLIPASFKKFLNIDAGAQNFVEKAEMSDQVKPVYLMNFDTQGTAYLIEATTKRIKTALYTDLFLMLQSLEQGRMPKTATEIQERHEEKLLVLGAVIERQFHELLDPLIERTFKIALRRSLIPEWPEEIGDTPLSIEYVSLLAQAQKLVGTQSINALAAHVVMLAQFNPEALDKFNFDESIDRYADMVGTPAAIINSDDRVVEIRAIRAQRMQKAQRQQEMAAMVQGAKTMSETSLDGETALSELKRSMEPV